MKRARSGFERVIRIPLYWSFVSSNLNIILLMSISFVLGAYTVYNTPLGARSVDSQIENVPIFFFGIGDLIPVNVALGDLFAFVWVFCLAAFVSSLLGHRRSLPSAVRPTLRGDVKPMSENTLLSVTYAFTALYVVNLAIERLQDIAGLPSGSLAEADPIETFTLLSLSPITEEIGFRATIIGLLAAFLLLDRGSGSLRLKTIWHPVKYLYAGVAGERRNRVRTGLAILIAVSALSFGFAHVIYGGGWEMGKVTTSTIAGVVLGVIYVSHGLVGAILLHWSFNYFLTSYHYFQRSLSSFGTASLTEYSLTSYVDYSVMVAGVLSLMVVASRVAERLSSPTLGAPSELREGRRNGVRDTVYNPT